MQFCPRQLYCSKFSPIVVTIEIKSVLKLSWFRKRFEPKENPLDPPSAAGDAHRRKWGFGKGSRQLIGFATQEYLQIARAFTN